MSRNINSTTTHLNLGYISIFTNLLHLLTPDVVHKAFLTHAAIIGIKNDKIIKVHLVLAVLPRHYAECLVVMVLLLNQFFITFSTVPCTMVKYILS